MIEKIKAAWSSENWRSTKVLLAVSGGADSVALLRAFLEIQQDVTKIAVAHFNHGWRGEESTQDARFVEILAGSHNLEFHLGKQQATASHSEECARDARYDFLSKTAYASGSRYVVTAHTCDDRVETILHNLFRGTGLAGMNSLGNFREFDEDLVLARPMLDVTRSEVVAYLENLGQSHRQDSSNSNTKYQRNFLRKDLLPLVRTRYESIDEKLISYTQNLSEVDELLSELAKVFLRESQLVVDSHLPRSLQAKEQFGSALFIPPNERISVHWPVLQRALTVVWREKNWPVGRMNREAWLTIRNLRNSLPQTSQSQYKSLSQLPGNLALGVCENWIIISEL